VNTETRVMASDASTARRFAAYWRAIYPGSALIRRMWLLAIERRAGARPGAPMTRRHVGAMRRAGFPWTGHDSRVRIPACRATIHAP
jgi:hypothetical protein